jgi:hypothetical protein
VKVKRERLLGKNEDALVQWQMELAEDGLQIEALKKSFHQ